MVEGGVDGERIGKVWMEREGLSCGWRKTGIGE